MKIIYIAHPIGGNVKRNLENIVEISRAINMTTEDVCPIAPYFLDCHSLDDNNPDERERGIKNDKAILESGVVNEMWLYGDRISNGMIAEIRIAENMGIKVIPMSLTTRLEYELIK